MSGRSWSAVVSPLMLTFLLSTPSINTPTCAASTDGDYPGEILRIRGGLVFPDPDHDPGPGRSVGGAIGLALSRATMVTLNYDHVDLDAPASGTARQTVSPVTIQVELGTPYKHRITSRFGIGAGVYLLRKEFKPYIIDFGSRTREFRWASSFPFGMNFGGGVTMPLWKRTAFDVDARYHQTMGGSDALIMGTVAAGLTYTLR